MGHPMIVPFDPVRHPKCPKCGSDTVHTQYVARVTSFECARVGKHDHAGEHFHRTCVYCHYEWPTFDVKGASSD